MLRSLLFTWSLLIGLAAWLPAHAAGTPSLVSDYRISSWSGGDGITLGEVLSIAQDPDGYLWLASEVGLVRFDGLRFSRDELVVSPSRLPVAPTRSVFAATDGSLWVGYGRGLGVYRLKGGQVLEVHLTDGIGGLVTAILEDSRGAMWIGHDSGLYVREEGTWRSLSPPDLLGTIRVFDLLEDTRGNLWVATDSGLFRRPPGAPLERASPDHGVVYALSLDDQGQVWVTDERGGVKRPGDAAPSPLLQARGRSLFHDSRGNLWLSTNGQGVFQLRPSEKGHVRRVTAQTGLLADENACIFEDRDGNIWVGSIYGLSRLTPHRVTSLVDLGLVRAVTFDDEGTAWVGTTSGLIAIRGATGQATAGRQVIPTAPVRALHSSNDRATTWVATDDGLFTLARGRVTRVGGRGRDLRAVTSMASEPSGVLWVTDAALGLVRVTEQGLTQVSGSAGAPVLVYVDRATRLWVALQNGTIRRLDQDGSAHEYGHAEGLPHSSVYVIHEDRRGSLWVGGNQGLSLLKGERFQTTAFQNALLRRAVASVTDDEAGDLWVGLAYYGFIRVSRHDLSRAFSDPEYFSRYRVYNTASGSGYPDVTLRQSFTEGGNGTLWSVTTRGITIIDPRQLRNRADGVPSLPRIEGVTADDTRYAPRPGLQLPPRTNRLGIDYAVVNLSSDERVRFRYRLDGFDNDWIDGTGRRRASYTNLPPRSYRFRLQRSTTASEWQDTQTTWAFAIQPMFYQTRWFLVLVGLTAAGCVMGAWRLRLRQVRKQFSIVFDERLRFSRLMHDTLLQSLYATALQLDFVSSLGDEPMASVRQHLARIRTQIEDYIADARESIFQLRSPVLAQRSLVEALRDVGERLTQGRVMFQLNVSGEPHRCPDPVETNALRIGHEAIMNAIRHSHADRIEMDVAYDERRLRLRITDNGCGLGTIPVSDQPSTHFGLTSMRERAAAVGGTCTIDTRPGGGVLVEADLPLLPT